MTVDEIRCLDNKYALLFLRGEKPIRDLKYQFEKHPNFLKTKNTVFEYGIENLPAIQMEVVQNEDFSEDIVDERLYNDNYTVEVLTEEDF